MKRSNIVSIDIRAFFGAILEQWIIVAVFSVITAVLLAAVMSVNDNKEAQSEAELYREMYLMSDEEKLNTLPELDRVDVSLALMQKGLIEQQEEYYENSIIDDMLNEGALPVLNMRWVVSGSDNAGAVSSAYGTYLKDADTVADWYEDLPNASSVEPKEAVFRIYGLETASK